MNERRVIIRKKSSLPGTKILFDESAAGIAISGDSGSGKSNLMLLLIMLLVQLGIGLTLIDPHGDLATDVERQCASLPDRIRRRVIVIRYSNTSRIVGMNPLSIGRFVADGLARAARIVSKVGNVCRILLHAWGERDFNSKPLLFKWTMRFLTMLARVGLTIADVAHFFDVGSPVYQALAGTAPDLVSRLEMEALAEMRPRDREDFIASTKNRFLGFLENPIVRLVLGRPDQTLDVARLIQEGAVIIISLERGGVLRDEDVEILANLWLNELLYAVYNTPREQRVPHFIFLDELPVFASSFDLLTQATAQVRKFKTRLVCAFQGTQFFPDRTDDRLLNAIIGQLGVQFYFRHKHPVDAKFFGEIVKLPSLDLLRPKHVLKTPQQFQEGHDVVVLSDTAANWSDAQQEGASQADAVSDTQTHANSTSQSTGSTDTRSDSLQHLADAVSRAQSSQSATGASNAAAHGTTRTDGRNWSNTRSRGGSVTRKTTLVPRIRTRDIVSSIQFFTADEQIIEAASRFTLLPVGTALLYIAGRGVAEANLPLAKNPFRSTPRFAIKKLAELQRLVLSRPEFATPEELVAKRIEFERQLVHYLNCQAATKSVPLLSVEDDEDDNPILTI
jgi:hypothetical protein